MRCPGVVDLLDAAVRNGADLVGGIDPLEIDRDPKGKLDGIFAIRPRACRCDWTPLCWQRLSPAAAERVSAAESVSEAEHDRFGDGDGFDEQEGAIGVKDAERAFDLAPPAKRQFAGYDFDDL